MGKYKSRDELVQERIDEKPWYKKILVLSERIVLALSAFTIVYALVSIALSVGMNMGKIAEDAGIVNYSATSYRASCFSHYCLANTLRYC